VTRFTTAGDAASLDELRKGRDLTMTEWQAAVDEFLHSAVQVLGAVATIALGASAAFRSGRRFWTNVWARPQAE